MIRLLSSMKYQLKKDGTPERATLIKQWLDQHFIIKFIFQLLETRELVYLKTFAIIILSLCRSGSLHDLVDRSAFLVYWAPAEEKTLRQLHQKLNRDATYLFSWKLTNNKILYAFHFIFEGIKFKKAKKFMGIAYRLAKKHDLLVAERALETILTSIYFAKQIHGKTTLFIISTESNPHGTALIHLAKEGKTSVAYIGHSPLIDNPLPLFLNAALFWGRAMSDQFIQNGSTIENIWFNSTFFPILRQPPEKRILIALSKNMDNDGLKSLVMRVLGHELFGKYKIAIRVHPNSAKPIDKMFRHMLAPTESQEDALRNSSFVIAGHSTFHLEALARKRPTFFSPEMDGNNIVTLPFLLTGEIQTTDELLSSTDENIERYYPHELYDKIRDYYFDSGDEQKTINTMKEWMDSILKAAAKAE